MTSPWVPLSGEQYLDGRDWTVFDADACDELRLLSLVDIVRGCAPSRGTPGGANHYFYQFSRYSILSARMGFRKRDGLEFEIHSSLFHQIFRASLTFDCCTSTLFISSFHAFVL
jgi:hypothetical protein